MRKAEEKFRSLGVQEFRSSNEGILICNVDILSNIDIPTLLQAYNPDEMGVVLVSERETQRYLLFNDENRLCGWTNIATGEVRGPIADYQSPIANRQLPIASAFPLSARWRSFMVCVRVMTVHVVSSRCKMVATISVPIAPFHTRVANRAIRR